MAQRPSTVRPWQVGVVKGDGFIHLPLWLVITLPLVRVNLYTVLTMSKWTELCLWCYDSRATACWATLKCMYRWDIPNTPLPLQHISSNTEKNISLWHGESVHAATFWQSITDAYINHVKCRAYKSLSSFLCLPLLFLHTGLLAVKGCQARLID